MIHYWSFWNFSWFLLYKLNILHLTYALKTSIIITSIIGAFITYVYPKTLIVKITNDIQFTPSYLLLVLSDLIFHQMPLILTINKKITLNSCSIYIFIPLFFWRLYNHIYKFNVDKLYGIKMNYIISICFSIYLIYSIYYHINYFKFLFRYFI